jgi:succinate dehydrogenase / fumarate reductase membrane anchor subunit
VSRSVEISPYTRGRARPTSGGRLELAIWYTMRISGVALFVLALAHFSILHFIWDPADQTAEFVMNERWNQLFWRGFDWLLLMLVLFHGWLGVRTVIVDYARHPTLRVVLLAALLVTGIILFIFGTVVVLTLPMPGTR